MRRVLAVWCPDLLEEQEDGRQRRAFGRVAAVVGTFSPAVEVVRAGVCAVGTRGPSRYFGGDDRFARMVADAVGAVPGVTAGVGVADGLFAAVLAAQCPGNDPVVVAAEGTAGFLAPWPLTTLGRPELADLLDRLGIRTLGRFAGLPDRDVLARFGVDGAACHRVAQGIEGELPGFRLSPRRSGPGNAAQNATAKDRPGRPGAGGVSLRQPAFWGGGAGAAARAGRALARVQELLGPEAVVTGRLQGGRGPAERARVVTWCGGGGDEPEPVGTRRRRRGPGAPPDPPWPGRVPPPAPVIVLGRPLPVQLVDGEGHPVGVSGGGMVTAAPSRLSVDGGVWAAVAGWAGPWPSDERWWSVPRRQARMQVVTGVGIAHLLTRERGGWWLEATYD